jgi:DNA-binding NarL/FixJ family response regulator
MQLNSVLVHPLGYGEIKQISKSVSRFCWKNDAYCYAMFIERQSMRGKLGNSSPGGRARSANYEPLRERALLMIKGGMKKKDIALELGVSDRTIRNWLK